MPVSSICAIASRGVLARQPDATQYRRAAQKITFPVVNLVAHLTLLMLHAALLPPPRTVAAETFPNRAAVLRRAIWLIECRGAKTCSGD
jgi:hypothetical protein